MAPSTTIGCGARCVNTSVHSPSDADRSLYRLFLARLWLFALLVLCAAGVRAGELLFAWEDEFSAAEQAQVQRWLTATHAAVERYIDPFPFPVRVILHRRDGASEPTPWANTWRGQPQSIHFYIDTRFPLEDFLADWTAPHEFSHLILPYLGRDNSWYAEGFASYLQHSVMVELGVIDEAEALRRRDRKMQAAVAVLDDLDEPMLDRIPEMKRGGSFPTLYWGGAVYFERVDMALREEGSSLQQVLRDFLACCRLQRRSLADLTATLDRVSGTTVFSDEMAMMETAEGVPPRP